MFQELFFGVKINHWNIQKSMYHSYNHVQGFNFEILKALV